MKLLGVLQLLYKWVAWTQLGEVDQTEARRVVACDHQEAAVHSTLGKDSRGRALCETA